MKEEFKTTTEHPKAKIPLQIDAQAKANVKVSGRGKTRVMQLPPLERNAQSGKYQHVGYVIVLICVKQLHTSLSYLTADENGLRNYTTVSVKLLDWPPS